MALDGDFAAVAGDGALVFFHGGAEGVCFSVGVGDEIEVVDVGGLEGGGDAGGAGGRNGAGREAEVFVGVVGGVDFLVFMDHALAVFTEGVLEGRVHL